MLHMLFRKPCANSHAWSWSSASGPSSFGSNSQASVDRDLRQWSAEHGGDLVEAVDLQLTATSFADPATWSGARWLQRHVAHVRHLCLIVHQVRTAYACAAGIVRSPSTQGNTAHCHSVVEPVNRARVTGRSTWGARELKPPRAPQKPAIQVLPAIALMFASTPLESLFLASPDNAVCSPIEAAQLDPLAALQQLRSLDLSSLDDFGPCLMSALRHLTALTNLDVATHASVAHGPPQCEVFDAIAPLTRLEQLCVSGPRSASIQRLPHAMSRLRRLRYLVVRNIRIMQTCSVLTTLTALDCVVLLLESAGPRDRPRPARNPLPARMDALRSLRILKVTCNSQPVPPLALPELHWLHLDAPSFDSQVSPADA